MVRTRFELLPRRAQIARIRAVALAALGQYPVEPRRVTLLDHHHNSTFRVDATDGRRFALRVNVNSASTTAHLEAETAWLSALAADTDVSVPIPFATRDGRRHTTARCDLLERDLAIVLMSWLPGRTLDEPTPSALRELGRTTALLHQHGERWTLPPGAALPSHADVLVGDPNRIQADHPLLTPDRREVIDAALAEAQDRLDDVWSRAMPHPIHADLHGGNVKWLRGRLSVFDFDDAVIGVPVLDLAISAYYLRTDGRDEQAVLDGYAAARDLPAFDDREFEALLAGRNLLLLNEVLQAMTADVRAVRERYVDNTVSKLRAYLDTGRYRHDVPGVVPLWS